MNFGENGQTGLGEIQEQSCLEFASRESRPCIEP
jgi:hypothetical protein